MSSNLESTNEGVEGAIPPHQWRQTNPPQKAEDHHNYLKRKKCRPSNKQRLNRKLQEITRERLRVAAVGEMKSETSQLGSVEERCRRCFAGLVRSPLSANLMSMPKRLEVETTATPLVSDLTGVKEKIGSYQSIDDFFYDLHEVILHGRDKVYKDNAKNLEILRKFEALVKSLEEDNI